MVQAAANGQIRQHKEEQSPIVARLVSQNIQRAITDAVPQHLKADRFLRIALTAVRANPKLQQSDEASFLACLLQAAQLGLEPNTPLQHAFLIPRKDNKQGGMMTTTLQIGYQGMIDLAVRSGRVTSISTGIVYPHERFEWEQGDDERIRHVPSLTQSAGHDAVICTYAIATLQGGGKQRRVVPRWELDKARARGAKDGAWVTDPEEMMRKTSVRRLYKLLPKSAEMAAASQIENAVDRNLPTTQFVSDEVRDWLGQATGLSLPEPMQGGDDYDPSTGEVSAKEEPKS